MATKALQVRELRELIEGLDEQTAVRVLNKRSKCERTMEITGVLFAFENDDDHAELVFQLGEEANDDDEDD